MLNEKKSDLLSLENKLSSTPLVNFYQGKLEVMKMYEELLKTGPFCAIFNPKLVKKLMPEYHYKIGEIIKQKKWSIRELVVYCEEAFEYDELFSSKLHKVKILPPSWNVECDIIIKDEITYMVSYGEVDLTGTKIVNKSIAEAQRVLFEYIWPQMK